MLKKFIGYSVLFAAILIAAMYFWTTAANMVSAKNDESVVLGVLLFGVIIGLLLFSAYKALEALIKALGGQAKKTLPLILMVLMISGLVGCTKVPPGYVGIKVYEYGSQKGVQDFPIKTGRVWYNIFTQSVEKFPTFMQTVVWTKDETEGSPNDDSITFNSVEGSVINADIGVSFQIEANMVPHLYVEFKQDAHGLTWGYVRSQVRDQFGRFASKMRVVDIFGSKKQELLDNVKSSLNANLQPKGFKFDMISFVGALRVAPEVQSSINAVITAMQKAVEAENKIRQTEAEAKQRFADAEGKAKSITIVAEAQAKANKILADSVSDKLINYETVLKWNGVLPQFTGTSGIPLIQLPQKK